MGGTEFTARKADQDMSSGDETNRHRITNRGMRELPQGNELPSEKPMRYVKTSVKNYSAGVDGFLKARRRLQLKGEHKVSI